MKKKDFFWGMFLGAGVCLILCVLLMGFINNKISLTKTSLDGVEVNNIEK